MTTFRFILRYAAVQPGKVAPHLTVVTSTIALSDGARPVVKVLAGVGAEILERALVSNQELQQGFVQARLVVTPPAEAEREHEDVSHGTRVAKGNLGLAPIDLALPPRRRLEPDEGPLAQILGVRRQQRIRPHRVVIRPPRRVAQAAADGLAIQVQAARNLGDRHSLGDPQATNLLPPLPADHWHLLAESDLCADGHVRRLHHRRHFAHPPHEEGGEISFTEGGDFCITADTKPGQLQ